MAPTILQRRHCITIRPMPAPSPQKSALRLRHQHLPVTTGGWCLRLPSQQALPRNPAQWHLLHTGPHSRIYEIHHQGDGSTACVAKLARPRSVPRDTLRKYLACQAYREYNGHHLLDGIGLQTLAVRGWGLTLAPWAEFESVLLMEPLPPCISALQLIRQETDTAIRLSFLESLADELARMHVNGCIHKDCHFDNICVLEDQSLLWIDNDIRRPSRWSACRHGLQKSITLLRTTARTAINGQEWRHFQNALNNRLSQHPDGERFLHELS